MSWMLAESLKDLNYHNLPQPPSGQGAIDTIIQLVIIVVGALSVLFVTIGGLRYVMSQGDPQAVSKAKGTIVYALIGIAITVVAQLIVSFVLGSL